MTPPLTDHTYWPPGFPSRKVSREALLLFTQLQPQLQHSVATSTPATLPAWTTAAAHSRQRAEPSSAPPALCRDTAEHTQPQHLLRQSCAQSAPILGARSGGCRLLLAVTHTGKARTPPRAIQSSFPTRRLKDLAAALDGGLGKSRPPCLTPSRAFFLSLRRSSQRSTQQHMQPSQMHLPGGTRGLRMQLGPHKARLNPLLLLPPQKDSLNTKALAPTAPESRS